MRSSPRNKRSSRPQDMSPPRVRLASALPLPLPPGMPPSPVLGSACARAARRRRSCSNTLVPSEPAAVDCSAVPRSCAPASARALTASWPLMAATQMRPTVWSHCRPRRRPRRWRVERKPSHGVSSNSKYSVAACGCRASGSSRSSSGRMASAVLAVGWGLHRRPRPERVRRRTTRPQAGAAHVGLVAAEGRRGGRGGGWEGGEGGGGRGVCRSSRCRLVSGPRALDGGRRVPPAFGRARRST